MHKRACLCVYTGFRVRGREWCIYSCLIAPAGAEEICNFPYSQTFIKMWKTPLLYMFTCFSQGVRKHKLTMLSDFSKGSTTLTHCPKNAVGGCCVQAHFPMLSGFVGECNNSIQPRDELPHSCISNLWLMSQDQQVNLPHKQPRHVSNCCVLPPPTHTHWVSTSAR